MSNNTQAYTSLDLLEYLFLVGLADGMNASLSKDGKTLTFKIPASQSEKAHTFIFGYRSTKLYR